MAGPAVPIVAVPITAPALPAASPVPPLAAYDEIRMRPLFSRSRRPATGPASTSVAGVGAPKLIAVAIGPHYSRALIRADDGRLIRAAPGDDIGGWTVTALRKDGAVMRDASDVEHFVRLRPVAEQQVLSAPGAAVAETVQRPAPRRSTIPQNAESAETMAEIKRIFEGSSIGPRH